MVIYLGEKGRPNLLRPVGKQFHSGEIVMKPFTAIAIFIFGLIALLHILRLLYGWEVTINGIVIPMWASVLGFIIAGGLLIMLWHESRQRKS